MLHACAPGVPADENPGLVLGTILGVAGDAGHRQADAHRLARHPRPRRLARAARSPSPPARRARASSPSTASASARPTAYGDDRALRLPAPRGSARRRAGRRRGRAREGRPAGGRASASPRRYDLAEEFVRWEIATADRRCGAGHQPLQPARRRGQQDRHPGADHASTRRRASCRPRRRSSKARASSCSRTPHNADALKKAAGAAPSLAAYLKAHLDRVGRRRLLRPARLRADDRGARGRPAARAPPRARRASAWPPAWASGPASCTRPARPTRAGPTAACSCRSPATTRRTCRCRDRSTRSAS